MSLLVNHLHKHVHSALKTDPLYNVSQHAALPDLDDCTSFFGVYDGHGGKSQPFPIKVMIPCSVVFITR